jgi:hypothetical protein
MMGKNILILLACFLFPTIAFSQDSSVRDAFNKAYKVNNPNQLSYYLYVSDKCPISESDVKKTLEEVFIRSRVKPIASEFSSAPLYLSVRIRCISSGDNYIFVNDVYFGRFKPYPAILYDDGYGNHGIGSVKVVKNSIKKNIEKAMAAFIKANFDL